MSIAVRVWEDNFKILSKIRSKSERNSLCFALIYYGFCGEIPQDLKLNKNNLILFDVLKNNFIAKNQGGAPVGNFNRCSTVEKNKSTDNQPLSENIKHKTESIISSDKSSDIIVQLNKIFTKHGLEKIKELTDERKTNLKERCKDVGGFKKFLEQIDVALTDSSFLRGEKKDWKADIDFFLQKSSWLKVLEGKYRDRGQEQAEASNIYATYTVGFKK